MGEAPPAAPASEAAGSARDSFWGDLTVTVAKVAVWGGCLYLLHRSGVLDFESMLDLGGSQSRKRLALKLPNRDVSHVTLTQHEAALVEDVIDPAEITDTFRDVGGLGEQVDSLNEHLLMPLRAYEAFHGHTGLATCPTGVLLHGPPGTGKTMLAKAVASESKFAFFSVTSSSVTSKYVGEGEKLMKALFSLARKRQPAVIFFDEIDALMSRRGEGEHEASRRVKTEFLTQLDGAASDADDRILVLAATNLPASLDEAVLRRMQKRIYIPLPDPPARRALIEHMMQKAGSSAAALSSDDLEELVRMTEGYSASDLSSVCREAAMGPIREVPPDELRTLRPEDVPTIALRHFSEALRRIRPSVSPDSLAAFDEWNALYGATA